MLEVMWVLYNEDVQRSIHHYYRVSKPYLIPGFIFLAVFLFYCYLSIVKYMRYQAYAFDLGIYAESSWKISQWMLPVSTIRGINQFGDHFSPVYVVLSLGYGVFNTPIYLLLLQILSMLAGGIPVYLIAREKLKSSLASNCVLITYFLQIGLIQALNFDFHLAGLSVGFISWAIYFWHKQRFKSYITLLVLSLFCKEDVAVLFGCFSIYLLLKRQWKYGFTTAILSGIWLILTLKVIIPYFLGKSYGYTETGHFLDGWDIKSNTLRLTFGENLGLPLLSPLGWVFSLGNLATRFLSASSNRWMSSWHYGANVAPALSIGVVFALSRFNKQTVTVLSVYVLLATFFLGWPFRPQPSYRPYNRHLLDSLMASVPADASVSAQDVLVPHLANRKSISLFPINPNADFVVLAPGLPSFPLVPRDLKEQIASMSANPNYVVEDHEGVLVFKNKNPR